MYEGLGEAYNVFFWLTALGFTAAAITVAIVWIGTRIRLLWCVIAFSVLGVVLAYGANKLFHHEVFVRRHQSQNKLVPDTGCVRYEPSFGHLFASYTMSRDDFERWVSQHPWKLQPYDSSLIDHDAKRLSFAAPDLAYATEMASDGGQLRVYYKSGMMYLSYNVM